MTDEVLEGDVENLQVKSIIGFDGKKPHKINNKYILKKQTI